MLVALDDKKERVYAFTAEKYDSKGNLIKYYCPECGEELILRKGNVYQHHFSHKSKDTICRLREDGGESDVHNFLKYKIKKIIEEDNHPLIKSEIEYPIGSRIADYYCEFKDDYNNKRKVAVEIVHKHDDIKDFIDKNEYYYDKKVHCVWVFNIDKFTSKSKTVTSNIGMDEIVKNNSGDFLDTIRVTRIIRDAQVMNFGKVYALDPFNERMYSIHIESIYSKNINKYPNNVVPLLLDDFKIKCSKPKMADDFLEYNRMPAGPYVEKYWDKKPYDYPPKNKNDYNPEAVNQSNLRRQFYNQNNKKLGNYNNYEFVFYKDNSDYLIFKNIRKDYFYKIELTCLDDVLMFMESNNIRISKNNMYKLFDKLNYITTLYGDKRLYVDSDIDVVVNKKESEEFDDLIDMFSVPDYVHKPTSLDDDYISYDEYVELKSKHPTHYNVDMRIIPKEDKFCLIEFLDGGKKYLHGCYDSWDEADESFWNLN